MYIIWEIRYLLKCILFFLLFNAHSYGQVVLRQLIDENSLTNDVKLAGTEYNQSLGCTSLENISAKGSKTFNKVQVTFNFTGSISTYTSDYGSCSGITIPRNSLNIGTKGSWNGTLTFSVPVNDIVIFLTATGPNKEEDFVFTSNAGTISIFSDNYCATTIRGNTIMSGQDAISRYGGGGVFKITAPKPFTQLNLRGFGGDGGSLIALCSESIRPQAPDVSPLTPAQQSVCRKEIPSKLTVFASGNAPLSYQWYKHNDNINVGGQLIPNAKSSSYSPLASTVMGTTYYYVVVTDTYGNSKSSNTASVKVNNCDLVCYKPGVNIGKALNTNVGLTTIELIPNKANWPLNNKGAWLVLASKTKGFVPNRVPFNTAGNPIGIPSKDFIEGMLVYDTKNNVLKVYTSANNGLSFGWYEMSVQTCPDE